MQTAYIVITMVVTCTVLGGGYLLYRRSPKGWPRHNKNSSNILTLREIAYMAALEEEVANREELFLTHGQKILTQMQELDHAYKRWEHARG